MVGNANSGAKSIGSIAGASASPSPTPSLLDSTMPPINIENVECVGDGSTQNPNSVEALPPKHKTNVQKSIVWEYFTKVDGADPKDYKSKCNYYNKLFSCHPRRLCTSSMLSHIINSWKKYPDRFDKLDKSQSMLSFDAKKEGQVGDGSVGNLVIAKYNVQKIREALAKMVIVDELHFKFVEGEGFHDFIKTVESMFKIHSHYIVMKDCMKIFISEKEKLRVMFLITGARVCLATDTWTSFQNLNYMCVTCHFNDCDWNLHKRIINLSLIPNHKWETIGKKIESCMLEWGISIIFTVKVDNASANDTAIEYLKRKNRDKVNVILDNEFMHMRCCAHILNLIVTNGLKEVSDSIVKVWNAVKHVKYSPSRFEKFKAYMET
jgi:hypothetical protein